MNRRGYREHIEAGRCRSSQDRESPEAQIPFLKVYVTFLLLSLVSSTSSLHPKPQFSIPSLASHVAPPNSPSSFLQTVLTNILFPFRRH